VLGIKLKSRLRVKFIILLVGLAILPFVLAMAIVIVRLQDVQRESVIEFERQIARVAAENIETFIASQFEGLKNISIIYPELSLDSKARGTLLERFLFRGGDFAELVITNSEGQEISRADTVAVISQEDLKDRSQSAEFVSVQRTGHYIGPLYIEKGQPFFLLGEEIRGIDRAFRGAIFARVDARIMENAVKRVLAEGTVGSAYIVNRSGIVVAHPDVSKVLAQKDFSRFPAVSAAIRNEANGASYGVYRNGEGISVLGVGVPISVSFSSGSEEELLTNWFVVVEQPASVALKIVAQITQFSLILLAVLLFLAAFAAAAFAKWIVWSIEQLHMAAKKLGEGSLKFRVYIKTHDELEDLADSFNSMAQRLDTSISELKTERRTISVERNKLEIILSGVTDAVVAVDLSRNIVLFNKAAEQLTGFTAQQVLGKPLAAAIKVFDRDTEVPVGTYCPVRKDAFEGVVFVKENLKILGSKSRERFMDLVVGQIKEGAEVNLGCILTIHDVTEKLLVEKMKSEFVSIAAHQLRTPLSALKWAVSLLMNGDVGRISKEQKEIIGKAYETNERMIVLVNDLLNAARIEEGRMISQPSFIDVSEVIQSTLADLQAKKKEKNFKIAFEAPKESLPKVFVDEEGLKLVVQNLVENAFQYTRPGGDITILCAIQNGNVAFSVQDSGIGIPEQEKERVFTKFFRGENAVRMETRGSGLGLFIARKIVEAHGGKIWFESKEGYGTTFSVSFPSQKI